MTRPFALIVVFATSFAFSQISHAQQILLDGRCAPDMPEISVASGNDENPVEYFTLVASPALYVDSEDDRTLDPEVAAVIDMHTALFKVDETGFRMLFRSQRKLHSDDFICAWIDKDDVLPILSKPQPVTVGTPIEWTDPATDKTRTLDNPLPLKAVLRSNPKSGVDDATIVEIYDKPTITSSPRTDASVFGIYLIYAEREVDGSFWYWIAGDEPHVPTRFSGWVPAEHVLLWESQLSLYFNEQSEATGIHVEPDFAARADPAGVIADRPADFRERSIGEMMSNKKGQPVTNIARFPILTEETTAAGRGKTVYRIGFFADSDQVEASSERGHKQQNVRRIDMLFVLDNTLSMTEYFPHVVSAVRNTADRIATINESEGYDVEVKYAAAYYGDYLDRSASPDAMQFKVISKLGDPGYTEHFDRLSAIAESGEYYKDGFADTPEAGLAGIARGIRDLQWSEETEFKVVVWIGDHGSRDVGNSENLGISDVRDLLVENDVLLLPINVGGRFDDIWNNQFIRQGNELAAVRGLETAITHDKSGSADFAETEREIEEAIANLYVSSLTASFAIREGTDIERTLAKREDLLELDIPAAEGDVRRISTAICEMAFGSVGCQNAARSGQFMGEGYVRYDDRLANFDFWVNLDYTELGTLGLIMDLTCRGFERSTVKRNIEQAMVLLTTTLGGDQYRSDIPVGEFLRRYIFLPANHFPSILESTPDRIEERWQQAREADTENDSNEETTRIADPICRSAKLLALASDNKRLIDPQTDIVRAVDQTEDANSTFAWTVRDNSRVLDFNWEWSQGGENNYFYLPVDFFPSRVEFQ